MKEYYGNYLGICIDNQDPEYRGRVQIFIPHIMPALYEGWNQEGQDISLECLGDNLPTSLRSDIVEKLKKILPWSEGALPILGSSAAGSYNSSTGQFNQTGEADSLVSQYSTINPTSRASFAQELQDPAVQERFYTLMKAEVGGQGPDAQLAFTETVFNRALAQGTSVTNIISNQKYYEPYQNGAFQRAASNLTSTDRQNFANLISKAQNGSNITNGATHNASGSVAASVRQGGYDAVTGSIRTIGGETYYSKTFEQKKLSKIFQPGSMSLNDPTMYPDRSSLPPVTSPFGSPEPPVQTSQQPTQAAIINAQGTTQGSTGNLQAALAAANRNSGVNFVTGKFPGKCAKATRSLANVTLGVGNHFGPIGPIGGSAKDTIGKNYWERPYTDPKTGQKGSLYERVSTNNYIPQEGDIGITTGGTHGHAKMVVGGQFRSDRIDDSAANLAGSSTAAVYRLTSFGQELYKKAGLGDSTALGQPVPDMPSSATPEDTGIASDDVSSSMVKSTTPTQPSPLDTTGMPQGAFVIPAPGALLWVFFREGNPLFPVYFAASYGQKEWQNAYKANSQPLEYGKTHILRSGAAGAIVSRGDVTEQGDTREMRLAHANGAYVGMHAHGAVSYSPNEYMQHTDQDSYWFTGGDEEDWTQGNRNRVTMGNEWKIVGNASQSCINTQQELLAKIKQINDKMRENG
jgi:hypothetical protein